MVRNAPSSTDLTGTTPAVSPVPAPTPTAPSTSVATERETSTTGAASAAPAPRVSPAGASLDPAHEALMSLRLAREQLGPGDGLIAERLAAVGEELTLLQEEVTVQLAEIDTAARARAEERHLVRRLVSSLPVALLVTDVSGGVAEANAAAAGLLGVAESVLQRKPVFSFIAPESRRTARNLLRTAVEGTGSAEGELDVAPRGGARSRHRLVVRRTVGVAGDLGDATEVSWVFSPVTAGTPESEAEARYRSTIVELCRIAATDAGLHGLLRRVAELAADGLPGVAAVSVVVGDPADATAVAWSSALAQTADGLQHLAGEGPMFEAFSRNDFRATPELFADERWSYLARIPETDRCAEAAIALPVPQEERAAGVIVLYSAPGTPVGADVADQAQPYVAAVQSLIRDARALDELGAVRDQLKEALTSRAIIDQAKGMIMMTRGCTSDEAFALLARMSSAGNRKVRDLARDFVAEASSGKRKFR